MSKNIKTKKIVSAGKMMENGITIATTNTGETVAIRITDGENLKKRIVKRGYLKHDELNNFLICHVMTQLLSGERKAPTSQHQVGVTPMWDEWIEKGILTKEQRKNMKTGFTFLRKFLDDVFENNLDIKTKDVIAKKSANWSFRLMDDYTVQNIYKMLNNQQEVHMSTEHFYDLIEAKMHMSCKGCTKNRCECDFHTFLESRFVPPMNDKAECTNCEYAY